MTEKRNPKEGNQEKKQEGSSSSGALAGSGETASAQRPKTDTIDDLLGGLSSDLEKIGVRTTAKGHCAACNKCIVGKVGVKTTETHKEELKQKHFFHPLFF